MEVTPGASRSTSAPREIRRPRRVSVGTPKIQGSPDLKIHIRKASRSRETSSSDSLSLSSSPIDETFYSKSPRFESYLATPRGSAPSLGADPAWLSPRRNTKRKSASLVPKSPEGSPREGNLPSPKSRSSSPFRKKRNSVGETQTQFGFSDLVAAKPLGLLAPIAEHASLRTNHSSFDNPLGIPHEIWIDMIPMLDLRAAERLSMASKFWQSYTWTFVTTVDLCPQRASNNQEWGATVKEKPHIAPVPTIQKQKIHFTPLMYRLLRAQKHPPFSYRLRNLSIDTQRLASDDDCIALYHNLHKFYNLKSLAILNMGISRIGYSTEQFKELSTLTALESLDLSGYLHLYRVLPYLADGLFPKLQHLYLRNNIRKRATPEVNDGCLMLVAKLTNLKTLHLTGFKKVTNVGIAMLTSLQQLEEFSVVDCQNTSRGISVALKAFSRLRTLELSHNAFSRSRDSSLFVVSKMTNLKSLSHFAAGKITDDVIYQIRHIASLECLRIGAAPYLTATGLEKLMPYIGPGLKRFHVRWCPTLKSLSFFKFLSNVEDVDLGGCYNIADRDLKALRNYSMKIRVLGLARMDRLTDACVEASIVRLTNLESLSVSGCNCAPITI